MATKSKLLQAAAGAASAAGGGGAATDDNINQVALLVHADGTNGDNNDVFLDEGRYNFSLSRNASVTPTTFSPYGNLWSTYYQGINYYNLLSGTLTFNTNWTIEAWVWSDSTFTSQNQILGSDLGPSGINRQFYIEATTNYLGIYDGTSAKKSTSGVPQNQWAHVAVTCSSGGTLTFYINGVASGTATISYGSGVNQMEVRAIGALLGGTSSPYNGYKGYISDLRIVNSVVYTTGFDVPTEPLTAISNTVLLACQSNRFKDNSTSGYTFTSPLSTPSVTMMSPYAPTDSYIAEVPDVTGFAFDGDGDGFYVDGHADLAFGTGDFTVECWLYINEHKDYIEVYDARGSGDLNDHVTIYSDSTGKIYFYVNNANRITSTAGDLKAREWNHFALVRSSSSTKMYLNGVQTGSTYSDSNSYLEPTTPSIGYSKAFNSFFMDGYISNFRAVKGTALYTSTFTPPTSALTDVSGTALLTCQDDFKDNSSNNLTFTRVGDPKLSEFNPLSDYWGVGFGQSNYTRLTLASSTALQIGSSDFTLELFFKASGITGQYDVLALKGFNVNNTREYGFEFNGSGGIYYLYSADGTGWTLPLAVPNGSVKPNKWHHLAAQRSGSRLDVWFDGTRTYTDASHPTTYNTGASDFMIGGYDDGSTAAYWMDGTISNLRLVNGSTVYTSNAASITVPTENLTAVTNTALLTCQSNRIIDNSSNAADITVYYKPRVLDSNPFDDGLPEKIGSASFNSADDYIETPASGAFSFGGEYTVEGWIYMRNRTGCLLDFGGSGSKEQYAIDIGTLYWGYPTTNGLPNFITNSDLNQWIHVAASRTGSTNYIWKNGSQFTSYTDTGTYGSGTPSVRIGRRLDGSYTTDGYVTDVRITNSCVYNGGSYLSFTPPTRPLQPINGTYLLTNFDDAHIIDSVRGNILNTQGATVANTNPKFGTGYIHLASNTNRISIPLDTYDLNLIGDFTVECFFKTDSDLAAANNAEFFSIGDVGATNGAVFYLYEKRINVYSNTTIINADASSYMNAAGQWNHVAYVRSGSTLTVYMNGTSVGSTTFTNTLGNKSYDYLIGGYYLSSATFNTNRNAGYSQNMDELRVTNGLARYTSNFTPPTSAFPNK